MASNIKTHESLPAHGSEMDALADLEHALHIQATGQRDLVFEKRLEVQTERIRQEILAKHGVLDIAVQLVRECRDEE